jgi:tetratricopeptide (TPR) repeat protein
MKVDLETLENYYEGRISTSEKEAFEKLVASDAQVAADLQNYILSKTAISSASNERLKKRLIESGKDLSMKDNRNAPYIRYLAIAASIAVIIGLGWAMFHFLRPHKSAEEIYLSYYQRPDITEFTVRGEDNDSSQLFWDQGLNYYANHKIDKAAAEFNKLIRMNKANSASKAYFMLALCYMEMNDTQRAIQTFGRVSDQSNFVYMKQYYSALCLIKMEKKKDASDLLLKIVKDENHPYRKKAIRIYLELK